MAFNFRKSVTFQLSQSAKAYRARSGSHLSRLGLHPGQESILKILDEEQGRTMGQLASALGVQPPTVAKMVNRLSAEDLVRRGTGAGDGRLVRVFLTEKGEEQLASLDKTWKRLEREALAGLEDKDRKKLRKLLKQVERNLTRKVEDDPDEQLDDDEDEEDSPIVASASKSSKKDKKAEALASTD